MSSEPSPEKTDRHRAREEAKKDAQDPPITVNMDIDGGTQKQVSMRPHSPLGEQMERLMAPFKMSCDIEAEVLACEVSVTYAGVPITLEQSLADHGVEAEGCLRINVDHDAVALRIEAERRAKARRLNPKVVAIGGNSGWYLDNVRLTNANDVQVKIGGDGGSDRGDRMHVLEEDEYLTAIQFDNYHEYLGMGIDFTTSKGRTLQLWGSKCRGDFQYSRTAPPGQHIMAIHYTNSHGDNRWKITVAPIV